MKTSALPCCPRHPRGFVLLLLCTFVYATTAPAGTFSTTRWTDDASTGINGWGQNVWAWHFGSTTPATVNGITLKKGVD